LPNKNLIQRRLIVFYSMALLRFGSKFFFVSVLLSLWFDLVFLFFFFKLPVLCVSASGWWIHGFTRTQKFHQHSN
jgi:hypothetical protein